MNPTKATRRRSSGMFAFAALGHVLLSGPVLGDVVFDGSLGPGGALSGDMVIGEEWGTRAGENLFHSFFSFDVLAGESATFTSPFATRHVIGRITGGAGSLVDGPLVNAIPGASLWLINPAGIVFGEGAAVDVQGSFHASTADYVLLDDGGRFSASLNDASGTVLTMGNPTTFGFLSPTPASIRLEGADISVGEGETIGLIAGGVSLDGSRLQAPGGGVDLVSVAGTGEWTLGSNGEATTTLGRGDLSLNNSSVDVSANASGSVYLRGGQVLIDSGTRIRSETDGEAGGDIIIDGDAIAIRRDSRVESGTTGAGDAGSILLRAAGDILLDGGARLSTATDSRGDAGDITLLAGGDVTLRGSNNKGDGSGLYSHSINRGEAGDVLIEAANVRMEGGAAIDSSGDFTGNAGNITLRVAGDVVLRGTLEPGDESRISSFGIVGDSGDIFIEASTLEVSDGFIVNAGSTGSGDAGTLAVRADNILISNQGALAVVNDRGGAGGRIDLDVTESVRMENSRLDVSGANGGSSGTIDIQTGRFEMVSSFIDASHDGETQPSGIVRIEAREAVVLSDSAILATSLDSSTVSADIEITTPLLELTDNSSLSTNSFQDKTRPLVIGGGAGDITIRVDNLVIVDSAITAQTCACGSGSPGNITIDASDTIRISGVRRFEAAGILSTTSSGERGGNIRLSADTLIVENEGVISTSSPLTQADIDNQGFVGVTPGDAGDITIDVRQLLLSDGGAITTEAVAAAGGEITLNVGELMFLQNASVSARAQGVAPGSDGGNLLINAPGTVVLQDSILLADANAGNGGNILISTGALVPDVFSTIDASSQTGIDGTVVVESPNQQISTIVPLDTPGFDVAELVDDPCEVRLETGGSSLTIDDSSGLPPAADALQPSPPVRPSQPPVKRAGQRDSQRASETTPATACAVVAP